MEKLMQQINFTYHILHHNFYISKCIIDDVIWKMEKLKKQMLFIHFT